MKRLCVITVLMINSLVLSATHNRAGEITYRQLSALTYEVTVTTYTYTLSLADRQELEVNWGDNSSSKAPRTNGLNKMGEILPNYYKRNIYIQTHTYPGPGVYKIVVQDPNRNYGVRNIPNSVNVVFSISTILSVNPSMGYNRTPVLLNPPYDKAALGYVFIHNPAAFDPDGDSLSYKLTVCTREDGKPIENFTLPPATHFLKVDSITGDLIWDTPADTGIYNVAMEIQEWRNGRKIGTVIRDMQIEVYVTNNKPPEIAPLKSLCVEVGEVVDFIVSATDQNNDRISLKATSGIFGITQCPADFAGIDSLPGSSSSRFTWIPCHQAVRNQPYNLIFKADDNNSELRLSDIDNMTIKVLGPSPVLLNAVPEGKFIRLTWENYGTDAITGFSIYRTNSPTTFVPDSCTSGIPPSTGFVKIGYIEGSSSVSFTDTDNGLGLDFGEEYTYRIVAVYPNGTESKSSNEITSTLVAGLPVIKNVSIRNTHVSNGSVFLSWKKPDRIDTIPGAAGPYEYIISRAQGVAGTNFTKIKSLLTTDLNDTVFIDTLINTRDYGYLYKIVLWNRTPGNNFVLGDSSYASSVFIRLSPGDRKVRFEISRNVPWINNRYDIFRFNSLTSVYDSVGTTNQLNFSDDGLVNGEEYCYYVRSTGGYLSPGLPVNLVNFSQKACETAYDNEPPCVPVIISVQSQCDSLYNTVTWNFENAACFDDVAGYKIFYRMSFAEEFDSIETLYDRYALTYRHYPGDIISGCYAVSAFDANGNESEKSAPVCVDECNYYEIPNVITPNNDSKNDRLVARTSGLVEKVDFRLYNRSGLLVFSTDRPRIDWDGTYKGKVVSPGVYFYQCEVYERRISGVEQYRLNGFVHVITEEGVKVVKEETK